MPPADVQAVYDLDATCLPGLIGFAFHLTSETSPHRLQRPVPLERGRLRDPARSSTPTAPLQAGFTTVRNLADGQNESIALRNAINAGIVPGPRIFTAGMAISSTGGHADGTDGYRQDPAGRSRPEAGHHQRPRGRVEGGAPALRTAPT